jgi:hypothetical protein
LQFTDVAPEVGLAGATRSAMKFGALFADFDNDGRPDLFTANGHLEPDIALAQPAQTYRQAGQLFRNTGNRSDLFAVVNHTLPPMVGRGCAYLDYDGDGKLDLVVTENGGRARLFRNESPGANNWVRLVLAADGHNRDALGAAVTVEAGGLVQRRYLTGSHGYLSQSELVLTVGLGSAAKADKVTARWPGKDGATETWIDLAAGKTHTLKKRAGK